MPSATDLKQLGVGGALVVIILVVVFRYLSIKNEPGIGDKSGDKNIDFWKSSIREIVKTEMEEGVVPLLKFMQDEQTRTNEVVRDRLHTIASLLQRIDAATERKN